MAGISSKALNNSPENKYKYNGNELQQKEFSDGSGLEVYDFNARTYDQKIGRFLQIDPEIEQGSQESFTPYHFGFNNPILYNDPDGRIPPLVWWLLRRLAWEGAKHVARESPKVFRQVRGDVKAIDNVMRLHPAMKLLEAVAKEGEHLNSLEKEKKQLSTSKESLEENVKEHEKKIEDFEKDPIGNSSEKWLKEAKKDNPTKETLLERAKGRTEALKKQLNKNKGELKKVEEKLKKIDKEIDKINNPPLTPPVKNE